MMGCMDSSHANAIAPFSRGQAAKCRAILDAATVIFCQQGVGSASIDAIAAKAGVSRQTVYNQMGDKEKLFAAVVSDISTRASARLLSVLAAFPEHPADIEVDLLDFAMRLTTDCMCDTDGSALRKLIENEGGNYPQLFETWKEYGPGKNYPALAARFGQLARDGYLDLDDPNLAARQFMALINADLPNTVCLGKALSQDEQRRAATNAVRTFLRAFAPRDMVRQEVEKRLTRLGQAETLGK